MSRYLVMILLIASFPKDILSQDLIIHKNDSTFYSSAINDITNVSFPLVVSEQNINIIKNDGNIYLLSISEIDSITFNIKAGGGSSCEGTPIVTYAGQTYNTVQIGNQCWLKENLNVGTKINSTEGGFQQTDNNIIEKYCYENDEANCAKYGGLYEWTEAMQYLTTEGAQGICPDGWHIPTYTEMLQLRSEVGGDGNALKAIGEGNGEGAGTNTSGFSGLLAGYRNYLNGYFFGSGVHAFIWNSSENGGSSANRIHLYTHDSGVDFVGTSKDFGFSVRCVKD